MKNKSINTYRCLRNNEFFLDDFLLVPIRYKDIETIRIWRNQQLNILRQQKKITEDQQEKYFIENVFTELGKKKPNNIIFSLLENSKIVAYGGLVHIEWENKRAEISFLVETKIAGLSKDHGKLLPIFLKTIKRIAFTQLELNKLTAELYDIRPNYKKELIKNGFIVEGILRKHVIINHKLRDSIIFGCFK